MSTKATLKLDLRSHWHAGSGRGSGASLDALVCKTAEKLPLLPGKTLKGLVRDAVNRWEMFGGGRDIQTTSDVSITDQLFGPRGIEGAVTYKGLLRFSNARLERDVEQFLATKDSAGLRSRLYEKHLSTAIDEATGTAKDKSLRGIEITIPMTLYAHLEEVDDPEHADFSGQWMDILNAALPLVRAVGSNRSRGFGRCVMSVEAVS